MLRNVFKYLGMSFLLLFILQACSSAPQSAGPVIVPAAKNPIFLWQMKDPRDPQSPTIYLYGTMHFKTKEMAYLDKSVVKAVKEVDRIFLEIDPKEANSVSFKGLIYRLGILPQSVFLKQQLPPELYQKLEKALDKKNIKGDVRNNIMKMRPWLAALTLATLNLQQSGNQQQYGSEVQLSALAGEQKKTIEGLETAEFQIRLFAEASRSAQEFQLQEAINEILGSDDVGAKATEGHLTIDELNAVYETGDYPRLDAFAQKMAKSPESRDFYKTALADRNRGMVRKLSSLSKEKKSGFAAIGVLHFAGPDNILELLKKQGYTIKRLSPKGKVDQLFVPAAPVPQAQDAAGWTPISTASFDVSVLGQHTVHEEKMPLKDLPGQNITVQTWTVEQVDGLMMVVSMEYPAAITEKLKGADPKAKLEVIKSMAQSAISTIGRIKSTKIMDSPTANSLITEFEGDQAIGRALFFEYQGRFSYLLSARALSKRQDPVALDNEKKFFKSLKLKSGN